VAPGSPKEEHSVTSGTAEPHTSGHHAGHETDAFNFDDISSILSREDTVLSLAPDTWAELILVSDGVESLEQAERGRGSNREDAWGWAGQHTSWLKVGRLLVNSNEHALVHLERTHELQDQMPTAGAGGGWGRYQLMRDVILTAKGLYILEAHTDVRTKGRGVIDVIPLSEILLPLRVDGEARKDLEIWHSLKQWCAFFGPHPARVRPKQSYLQLPLSSRTFQNILDTGSKRAALIVAISKAVEVHPTSVKILQVADRQGQQNGGDVTGGEASKGNAELLGASGTCVIDFEVTATKEKLDRMQHPMLLRCELIQAGIISEGESGRVLLQSDIDQGLGTLHVHSSRAATGFPLPSPRQSHTFEWRVWGRQIECDKAFSVNSAAAVLFRVSLKDAQGALRVVYESEAQANCHDPDWQPLRVLLMPIPAARCGAALQAEGLGGAGGEPHYLISVHQQPQEQDIGMSWRHLSGGGGGGHVAAVASGTLASKVRIDCLLQRQRSRFWPIGHGELTWVGAIETSLGKLLGADPARQAWRASAGHAPAPSISVLPLLARHTWAFLIKTAEGDLSHRFGRSYLFQCMSRNQRLQWVTAIEEVVRETQRLALAADRQRMTRLALVQSYLLTWQRHVRRLTASRPFRYLINSVILFSFLMSVLRMQQTDKAKPGTFEHVVSSAALTTLFEQSELASTCIFAGELALHMAGSFLPPYGPGAFMRDPWNWFDVSHLGLGLFRGFGLRV